VQNIDLLIADEIQLVGGEFGLTYEVVISRTCYVTAQTEVKTCIVACGVLLAFLPALFSTDQISKQIIKHSEGAGIESVYDVMEMEDGKCNKLLQMDGRHISIVEFITQAGRRLLCSYPYL
jgi:hypothetical protein